MAGYHSMRQSGAVQDHDPQTDDCRLYDGLAMLAGWDADDLGPQSLGYSQRW